MGRPKKIKLDSDGLPILSLRKKAAPITSVAEVKKVLDNPPIMPVMMTNSLTTQNGEEFVHQLDEHMVKFNSQSGNDPYGVIPTVLTVLLTVRNSFASAIGVPVITALTQTKTSASPMAAMRDRYKMTSVPVIPPQR